MDSIFTFNALGTYLWGLLAHGRTAAELSSLVTERFDVGEAQAQSDVRNFLAELREAGLVRTV